jgi:hypothetical protein
MGKEVEISVAGELITAHVADNNWATQPEG